MLIEPDPATLTAVERGLGRLVRGARRVPGLRAVLLSPVVARPGFWFATAVGAAWGAVLFGRFATRRGMRYVHRLPAWAFGRGGTTIGAVFLTRDAVSDDVLDHEAVHKAQWKRYGLAFIPLYVAAGSPPLTNRFEVEAGLAKGGYVRPRPRPPAV